MLLLANKLQNCEHCALATLGFALTAPRFRQMVAEWQNISPVDLGPRQIERRASGSYHANMCKPHLLSSRALPRHCCRMPCPGWGCAQMLAANEVLAARALPLECAVARKLGFGFAMFVWQNNGHKIVIQRCPRAKKAETKVGTL